MLGQRSKTLLVNLVLIVGEAGTAGQAIEAVGVLSPDVVLMDIGLPDRSGIEAAGEIKQIAPDTSIVALTIHEDEEYFFKMLEVGASGYVPKRAAPNELLTAIRTAASGEVYLYPSLAKLLVKDYLLSKNIPLIVNDRIDIALALNADGVHLGQEDMPVDLARKIIGPQKIIGASVFSREEAKAAEILGADYLGLSPIFTTETKPELSQQIGVEGIPRLKRSVRIPLVGIGSMNQSSAYEAVRAGLDGIAVVSAICSQEDPKAAAQALKAEVLRAKGL